MFTEWLKLNEHIWLFWQLNTEIIIGVTTMVVCILTLIYEKRSHDWLQREYEYDKAKDDARKQRKTKTTKKTTKSIAGDSTTEETTEVIEPIETVQEEKND